MDPYVEAEVGLCEMESTANEVAGRLEFVDSDLAADISDLSARIRRAKLKLVREAAAAA